MIRLLITTGDDDEEEVLAILVRHCPSPPQIVEHEGIQYVLKREWMTNVYVYSPSQRTQIDDFLGNEPL